MESVFLAFVKGGFGYLIVRELLAGIRRVVESRIKQISLLIAFSDELKSIGNDIDFFQFKMSTLAQNNQGLSMNQIVYVPTFGDISDKIFRYNSEKILNIFRKSDETSVKRIEVVYRSLENYKFLLNKYRSTFMGTYSVSYSQDPHIGFSTNCVYFQLQNVKPEVDVLLSEADKIKNEHPIWKKLKSKPLNKVVRTVLFIFLIFLPDEKLL